MIAPPRSPSSSSPSRPPEAPLPTAPRPPAHALPRTGSSCASIGHAPTRPPRSSRPSAWATEASGPDTSYPQQCLRPGLHRAAALAGCRTAPSSPRTPRRPRPTTTAAPGSPRWRATRRWPRSARSPRWSRSTSPPPTPKPPATPDCARWSRSTVRARWCMQGDMAEAETALANARTLDPQSPYAWLLSATLARRLDKLDEAQRFIETAADALARLSRDRPGGRRDRDARRAPATRRRGKLALGHHAGARQRSGRDGARLSRRSSARRHRTCADADDPALRPRPGADPRGRRRDRSAGRGRPARRDGRAGGVQALLGRRASRHARHRRRRDRGRAGAHRPRDLDHPHRLGRDHAAQPQPVRDRRAVRHARRPVPGANRPRARARAGVRAGSSRQALRKNLHQAAEYFPQDVVELRALLTGDIDLPIAATPGLGAQRQLLDARLEPVRRRSSPPGSACLALRQPLRAATTSTGRWRPTRGQFRPSARLDKPHAMAAMTVIAAETDEEAELLASSQDQSFVRLRTGDPGKLPPPVPGYRDTLPESCPRDARASRPGSRRGLARDRRRADRALHRGAPRPTS